jgi:hypothetical protein
MLLGKTAGQDYRARLPSKTAEQDCRARLPGKTAVQSYFKSSLIVSEHVLSCLILSDQISDHKYKAYWLTSWLKVDFQQQQQQQQQHQQQQQSKM